MGGKETAAQGAGVGGGGGVALCCLRVSMHPRRKEASEFRAQPLLLKNWLSHQCKESSL